MNVLPLAQLKIQKPGGSDACAASNDFCPDWIVHHLDRYWTPLLEHVYLTVVPVAIGFAISMALAILAHRRRWLTGPIITITGIFFAIPSVAAFFLLQPITGLGYTTAIVALV
ncbi:MAG: osmoprotectant transport system permease protein, partial [bacterium]